MIEGEDVGEEVTGVVVGDEVSAGAALVMADVVDGPGEPGDGGDDEQAAATVSRQNPAAPRRRTARA